MWEPLPELPRPEVRRKLREAVGVTVTQAAALLGVARQTYARWEGGATPGTANLRRYHGQLAEWEAALR